MSAYETPTTPVSVPRRRLYRSRRSRVIAGVCGGIAEYFGWSPTVVRLLTLLSFLLPGTQLIIYLIMWIVVPNEPRENIY